jgi:hypothetical protein
MPPTEQVGIGEHLLGVGVVAHAGPGEVGAERHAARARVVHLHERAAVVDVLEELVEVRADAFGGDAPIGRAAARPGGVDVHRERPEVPEVEGGDLGAGRGEQLVAQAERVHVALVVGDDVVLEAHPEVHALPGEGQHARVHGHHRVGRVHRVHVEVARGVA